jgi:DUF4097 and DUF4098 domain-containing protein YvlB
MFAHLVLALVLANLRSPEVERASAGKPASDSEVRRSSVVALAAQAAPARTDQTVPVKKGARLDVNNFAGEVIIKVWDREAVRVEVEHADGDAIDVTASDQVVSIRAGRRSRGPRSLDYTLTIPNWMPISVNGTATDVTVQGAGADIAVETVRGDITINGGSGFVRLRSVQGEISLEKARGRIEVRSYNRGIRMVDVSGDITAEAINGEITMERIDSSNVDVSTVNGEISYEGPIKDNGTYRLTTHNGLVELVMTERTNATVTVRTYNGNFRSSLPIRFSDPDARRRTVTLGNGSAHVDLETFNGLIAVRRPGEPRVDNDRDNDRPRPRRREQ